MGGFLKQSTACVIPFGVFVDKTDGVTLEVGAGIITSLDHATTGIFLSKNGGAGAIRSQAVTATTLDAYGMFLVTLSTTDTNTCGRLRVMMAEAATFLPVWDDFMVVNANVFDSLFAAATTDYLQVDTIQFLGTAVATPATAGLLDVNVKQISTDATAADNAELMFDGTGYAGGTTKLGVDVVAISADATAADNAELFFDGTGYAGGTARLKVDVDTLKTQAITCAAGVTVLASVGTAATSTAQTGDSFPLVSTEVAEIYAAVITNAAGVDIAADIIAVKADTAAILIDTDVIGALGAGLTDLGGMSTTMKAQVESEANDALVANNLDHIALTAVAIPAIPAGTYIDQMMDDGTAVYDRTTDSLQAVRDQIVVIDDFLDTEVAAILADTNELQVDWVNGGRLDLILDIIAADTTTDIPSLIAALNNLSAANVNAEVVDVLRTDTIPDSYAADGAQPTFAQAVLAIQQFLQERVVAGTTVTIKKPDGATSAMTFTISDATAPVSITRST